MFSSTSIIDTSGSRVRRAQLVREQHVDLFIVVMRACEGCRRRKIKCDAATTNTWPCSACTRLKLHCVPPMLQFDRDFSSNHLGTEHEQNLDFGLPSSPAEEEFMQQDLMRKASRTTLSTYPRNNPNYRTISPQSSQSHSPTTLSYTGLSSAESIEPVLPSVFQTQVYHSSPPAPVMRPHGQWQADNDYASALVGSLNIDDSGVGKWRPGRSGNHHVPRLIFIHQRDTSRLRAEGLLKHQRMRHGLLKSQITLHLCPDSTNSLSESPTRTCRQRKRRLSCLIYFSITFILTYLL
jgi:hypothetical protein